jgi:predicted nucleic acid-binding protein
MTVELIYWDSVAFLAHFQQEEGRVAQCQATLERAARGDVGIITSSLAIAECLWLRNHPPIPKDRAEIVRRFFRHSYIRVRNVTRLTAESAQDLVWDHGIKPKDAIHVATALEAGLTILETFDHGLISRTGLVGSPPLVIREPSAPDQRDLFPLD